MELFYFHVEVIFEPGYAALRGVPMKLIDILSATPIPIGYRLAFLTNFMREPLLRRMER